jgi:chemotaxis protein methyltransferase CheR
MVVFRRLNLMEKFPFKKPLNLIFCRNVMIYFDKPTQSELVGKFYEALAPGGYLFIGHSESLNTINHRFKYIQPTVYRK